MKMLLVFCSLLIATHGFSISDYEGEFGIAVGRAATTCEENNKNGYICSANCKELWFCYKNGDTWSHTSKTCDDKTYCNVQTGKCDLEPGHCKTLEDAKIQCTAAGIFPDPEDCQRYHACQAGSPGASIPIDCVAGTYFDLESGKCAVGTCDRAPIVCSSVGQTGGFSDSCSYYYFCGADGTMVFACNPGYIYSTSAGKCVIGTVSTTVTPPTVTCGTHGENVRDPANCYYYYSCKNNQSPVLRKCPSGHYFDRRTRDCRRGRCPY